MIDMVIDIVPMCSARHQPSPHLISIYIICYFSHPIDGILPLLVYYLYWYIPLLVYTSMVYYMCLCAQLDTNLIHIYVVTRNNPPKYYNKFNYYIMIIKYAACILTQK